MRRHILLVALALLVAACTAGGEGGKAESPVKLDPASDIWKLTLTESAAERLDIQTTTVEAADTGYVVPSAAIIIIPDGTYWVYTTPEPLVYVREQLHSVIERDLMAYFEEGPPIGTEVVTVGVPELYGAEFGIGK